MLFHKMPYNAFRKAYTGRDVGQPKNEQCGCAQSYAMLTMSSVDLSLLCVALHPSNPLLNSSGCSFPSLAFPWYCSSCHWAELYPVALSSMTPSQVTWPCRPGDLSHRSSLCGDWGRSFMKWDWRSSLPCVCVCVFVSILLTPQAEQRDPSTTANSAHTLKHTHVCFSCSLIRK